MQITEAKRQEAVDYSVKAIHYITEKIGPRESGMENELKAEQWLKGELETNGWVDSAAIEEFKVARHGLVGFTKVIGVLLIFGGLLQLSWLFGKTAGIIASAIGLALIVFSLLTTVLEFLFYKKFLDPFMENTMSHNVYGKYAPKGEVKRRIVFCGHVDSAYEWPILKIKQSLMVLTLIVNVLCALTSIGIEIAAIIIGAKSGAVPAWMYILAASFAIPYISLFLLFNFKVVVPGANDNLTGTLNAVTVLKCLKESGIRYENTEVCCLLTGSEEAGLRGADDWSKKHYDECMAVPTAFIAFDNCRDLEFLTIYDKDMTGVVQNDMDVSRLLDKACAVIGRPLKHGAVPLGSSDAAAVSKNGLKASCVAGQDPLHATYYHNCRDTADILRPDCMRVCLDLSLAAADVFDKEGFEK